MKTNGFNLEEIHFKDQQKIDCIFAMVTLAYIFAIQEAIIDLETAELPSAKAIPLKRYTDKIEKIVKEYPEISLFRWAAISMGTELFKINKKIQRLVFLSNKIKTK